MTGFDGWLLVLLTVLVLTAVATGFIAWLYIRRITIELNNIIERFEETRNDVLAKYVDQAREQNARYVAETRAATLKMNAVADALWEGLQGTVRER